MPTDEEWETLRAYFDEVGMKAIEDIVAKGTVDRQTAGQRVAQFNDILIEQLKEKLNDRG